MIMIVITPLKMRAIGILMKILPFDYSFCLKDVFKSVHISSLHMLLSISKMACMHIENNERSVFIVLSSKRDKSPIVFGKG